MRASSAETELSIDALNRLTAEEMIHHAVQRYGPRCAIGTSLQKTGIVIVDMAARLQTPFRVFFVDTLLDHPETYALLGEVEARYGITIERYTPDPQELEALYQNVGQHAHFLARTTCCRVRKVHPLQRALRSLDVWISGLRADQSDTRKETATRASWVPGPQGRQILKLNPLLDWTQEDVDRYTDEHGLPYNKLYDYVSQYGERYTVLGCVPCHIPVKGCFNARAGKFPWEHGDKECGLHEKGSGI